METSNLSPEQKEQARHGGRLFPLKKYITRLTDLHPSVAAHWHDEAELTLITEGNCTYHIHLDAYDASAGDLLFVPPAELHSINMSDETGMVSKTYVFHMDYLGAGIADLCSVKYLTPICRHTLVLPCVIHPDHPAYPALLDLFLEMNRIYETTPPGYELLLKSRLLSAVAALVPYKQEKSARPQLENEHTEKLKLALEYIGEHYAEEISIARLARLCYFSEYHFMRFFKKYIGISCLEYIKNLRLENAAARLAKGENSILEISMSCGFSNLSYFYREFKKKYGMTPKKFAKNIPESEGTVPPPYSGML